MSIINQAYVESACGEAQAKSVAFTLLEERDALATELLWAVNQLEEHNSEYHHLTDTVRIKSIKSRLARTPFLSHA